jgi:hypothetical protein
MKYCSHCGHELLDEAVVCPNCGCAAQNNVPYRGKQLDILSILGFVLSFFFAVAGLVVSIIAYNRVKFTDDNTSKGFAKAGIIISAVELGVAIVTIFTLIVLFVIACVAASGFGGGIIEIY